MAYHVACIKCGVEYESEDEDPYYCPSCLEKKNVLAKQIDEKVGARIARGDSRKTISEIEKYDSLPKKGGFVEAKYFL